MGLFDRKKKEIVREEPIKEREREQEAVKFPDDPLELIRLLTPYELEDTQRVAALIVDPNGEGIKTFWDIEAWILITATILHVLYRTRVKNIEDGQNRKATVADVLQTLTPAGCTDAVELFLSWQRPPVRHLSFMDNHHFTELTGEESDSQIHPFVKMVSSHMALGFEATVRSVLMTATMRLICFMQKVVVSDSSSTDDVPRWYSAENSLPSDIPSHLPEELS